jgi:hypothetical protein
MPIRQWVLSLPWELGWLAADAAGAACGIACARSPGGTRPAARRGAPLAKKKFSGVLTFCAGLS